MSFKINQSKFVPIEWTKSQKDMISTINEKLKDCFKPKDNRNFLLNEIDSYNRLLQEIEGLPIEFINDHKQKVAYIKIRDIELYKTKMSTKRYFLVRSINYSGPRIIYGTGANKNSRMIKLKTIQYFIHTKIKNLSNEMDGIQISPEKKFLGSAIVKHKNLYPWGKNKQKFAIRNDKFKDKRFNIDEKFQKDIESFIKAGINGLHYKHDLFKPLNFVERTVYRWKQNKKFTMELGVINLIEFYDFVKSYPQKFKIEGI
jgi:hypothetical protein